MTTMLNESPAAARTAPAIPGTSTGSDAVSFFLGHPGPTAPNLFSPAAYTWPFAVMKIVCA